MPAAAGLLLLLWLQVGPGFRPVPDQGRVEQTRLKGFKAGMEIYLRSAATAQAQTREPQQIADGQRLMAADRLQIFVHPLDVTQPRQTYAALISIDGAGQVTQIWPAQATQAQALQLDQDQDAMALPFSYALDAAPGFERFILLRSPHSFALPALIKEAKDIASTSTARRRPLTLPKDVQQQSLLVRKQGEAGE